MVLCVRVVRVRLTIGSLWMVSVIEIERSLAGSRLLCIVVCEFERREKRFSILFLEGKGSNELLDNLDSSFRLSISLGVFCSRHEKLYSQYLVQAFPKMRGESGITI